MDKTKITIELHTLPEIPEATKLVCVILKQYDGDKWLSAIYSEERKQFLDNVHFDPIIDEIDFWFYLPLNLNSDDEVEDTNTDSPDSGLEAEESSSTQEDLLPTIQTRLTQRAKDLSLSIIKPDTFARKLREELISIAGPEAAITYHISAQFDSSTQQLNFQIARLSPKTAIKLQSSLNVTTLQLAYTSVTQSGWRVSIGLNAAYTGIGEKQTKRFKLPKEAETKIEFGVTLSR